MIKMQHIQSGKVLQVTSILVEVMKKILLISYYKDVSVIIKFRLNLSIQLSSLSEKTSKIDDYI